jgi:hypothetical protein
VDLVAVAVEQPDLLAGACIPHADDAGALRGYDLAAVDIDDAGEIEASSFFYVRSQTSTS